jgi:hypothetical protein
MTDTTRHANRRAALLAGLGLLVMALLAGVGNFVAIQPVIVVGDAARTAENIAAGTAVFRLGILALLVVAVLDIVVAWALRTLFAPVAADLASLVAWLRVGYAAVFVAAIGHLLAAVRAAEDPASAPGALDQLLAFTDLWNLALVVFGLHLMLLGVLAWRSELAPRVIAVLVAVAGTGYLVDGVMVVLLAAPPVGLAQFAFVGEVTFLGWLLVHARRLAAPAPAPAADVF